MEIDLSVVIVTYRCLPFTRLCLQSLLWEKPSNQEVIIIDNNSGDDSLSIIRNEFPTVKTIENKKNVGFGAACNQGIALAQGRYLLMLNPDTVVPQNLSQRVTDFMDAHPGCGAMGVKMIDGAGRFLRESKRGIPSVWRAFCHFSGLTALFPCSRFFSGYYLGHLSHQKTQEVEVLSGAFMVLNREAIKKTGGFDERFFMYGEDIDLSYRISRAGFKVMYNPEIIILHFKGESTIKNKHYVKIFYSAMEQFQQKHVPQNNKVGFRLVKLFITLIGWFAQLKYNYLVNSQPNTKLKLNHSEYSIIRNNAFIGKQKTCMLNQIITPLESVEELRKTSKANTCYILSLSLLSPEEGLTCFRQLSEKKLHCGWIDQTGSFLYIGRSAHKQTVVLPVDLQINHNC